MTSAGSSFPTNRRLTGLLCLLVGLAAMVVFVRIVGNDFVNMDDPAYVTDNPHVLHGVTWDGLRWAFAHAEQANWHPLTWLSHMLDVTLFGMAPGGHHAVSLVIHAINTCLLFRLLMRMTGRLWPSFLVAVIFGIHPLRVESVAWVSERKDLLCGLFSLLTIAAYIRFTTEPTRGRYACVAGAYALALLAKPMAVTLPAVLWLLDDWPLDRWRVPVTRRIGEKLPLLVMAIAVSVITYLAQDAAGAVGEAAILPWSARMGNAMVAYLRYIGKTFWPVNLGVFYPHPGYWPVASILLAAAVLVTVTALVWLWRRNHRYLLTGWLWYLGMLVPVIGLIQVGRQSMADRYTYLPGIGLLLMLVWGGGTLWARFQARTGPLLTRAAIAVLVVAVCALGWASWRQTAVWADSTRLFTHTLAVAGPSAEAYFALGGARLAAGDPADAEARYRQSLALDGNRVDAWRNLAEALYRQGKIDEALGILLNLIRASADSAPLRNQLGVMLAGAGRLPEAVAQYRTALLKDPDQPDAWNNLGLALVIQGDLGEAREAFATAVAKPDAPASASRNLARTQWLSERIDAAVRKMVDAMANADTAAAPDEPVEHARAALSTALGDYRRAVSVQSGFQQKYWSPERYAPVRRVYDQYRRWVADRGDAAETGRRHGSITPQ